jgi:integrase
MREASTVKIKTESLRRVCASFGGRVACSLTPLEVEKWSATEALRRGWNAGTVRLTLKGLLSCLRWAAKHNVIPSNPLTALEMPGAQSRGREVVLTPEQETTVLAAARGRNLALVVFLRETGCRPSEVSVIEAQHFKPERRAIVIPPRSADGKANHKTASTGKDRTIYLTGAAQAVVEQLAARFPSGPLFRCQQSPRDRRPGKRSVALSYCAIRNVMTRLSAKTGIKGLIAYSFRHTFAVRWLRAGKPVEALAELLGTSPKMIHDHYGHLAAQTDYLRRLADDFGAARDSAG